MSDNNQVSPDIVFTDPFFKVATGESSRDCRAMCLCCSTMYGLACAIVMFIALAAFMHGDVFYPKEYIHGNCEAVATSRYQYGTSIPVDCPLFQKLPGSITATDGLSEGGDDTFRQCLEYETVGPGCMEDEDDYVCCAYHYWCDVTAQFDDSDGNHSCFDPLCPCYGFQFQFFWLMVGWGIGYMMYLLHFCCFYRFRHSNANTVTIKQSEFAVWQENYRKKQIHFDIQDHVHCYYVYFVLSEQ